MTDAYEKVRGVRELPLFPLNVVLFPGMPMPLHIFEPRYRKMLADIRASDNLFGLSCFDPESSESDRPPAGHVGCVAEVAEAQTLPDGRSNILTLGLIRYRAEEYVERGEPYLVARVTYFEDEEEDEQFLKKRSEGVAQMFMRIARAVRVINDESADLPDISDTEPERLSFLVAAAIEVDLEVKQELLELRSTSERLERLRDLLARVITSYEERARIHAIAKRNGHGGKKVDMDL